MSLQKRGRKNFHFLVKEGKGNGTVDEVSDGVKKKQGSASRPGRKARTVSSSEQGERKSYSAEEGKTRTRFPLAKGGFPTN